MRSKTSDKLSVIVHWVEMEGLYSIILLYSEDTLCVVKGGLLMGRDGRTVQYNIIIFRGYTVCGEGRIIDG